MTRPVDWAPLAPVDPLPGDPDAIAFEAGRLSGLGADMRAQAARLRQIGTDTTLQGAYAQELRAASTNLATDLDKAAGRYDRVGSALTSWAPELATAQDETLRARTKALEADALRAANSATPPWGDSWSHLALTATANRPALDDAIALFAQAQRMLRDTLDHAEARGRHYARLIDDANDIFKDGRWDNFKDFVDRNADWIDGATTALGWVATAAAIGAIFIPGVNVLVWGAVGLTVLSGVAHTTLAATGNGSWLDVGLDVFALATFGMGLAAARGLQGAQLASRVAATTSAGDEAAARVIRSAPNARSIGIRAVAAARGRAAAEVSRTPLATASAWEAALVGGRPAARELNDLVAMATRFPNAPGMAEALHRGARFYGAAQMSHLSGIGADAQSKVSDVAQASHWIYRNTRSAW